jgi:hypothetical protein
MDQSKVFFEDPALRQKALERCHESLETRRSLATCATYLMTHQQYAEALRIFDAIIGFNDLGLPHYCNALWVVQEDNTKLPKDPIRARRYLEACLPFAPRNPTIYVNAVGVNLELGDAEAAISHLRLAAKSGVDIRPFLEEPLVKTLADHPQWPSLVAAAEAGRDPEVVPPADGPLRPVPEWANFFSAEEYAVFRATLVDEMRRENRHFHEEVLDSAADLAHLARKCHALPRAHWRSVMIEFLRFVLVNPEPEPGPEDEAGPLPEGEADSPRPNWAKFFTGKEYAHFRALVVEELQRVGHRFDEEHLDHGVIQFEGDGGSLGLVNIARRCRSVDRVYWQRLIAEHLRVAALRPTGKPVVYEKAEPGLRLRIIPDYHLKTHPEAYVARELARGLLLAVAIDTPEQVIFLKPEDAKKWDRSLDDVFAIARRNTEAEPALQRDEMEISSGLAITALMGESYFAASHVLFLERYFEKPAHGYLVAVPDRHALFVLPMADGRFLEGMGSLVTLSRQRFTEEPGAITDQLYWLRGPEDWVKVACGVRSDGQPWIAPPEEFNELITKLQPPD